MNNERRAALRDIADRIDTIVKELRQHEREEVQAFKAQPESVRKQKRAQKKAENIEFWLDDAACCAGDSAKLVRKTAKAPRASRLKGTK